MNITEILDDLSAFADDPNDVVVQRDGSAMFVRAGREIDITCREKDGNLMIEYQGEFKPYKKFIAFDVARLDVFAQRLLSKRPSIQAFVDGPSTLKSVSSESKTDRAMELLDFECVNVSPFCSRVVFITADAGHGKTALLREYQSRQAEKFLKGKAPFLFWHVDLQGRQLLRLHEALMGDLGDLRMSGLWMAGIVRLLKHRLLVLAIDGFDELAAEQGQTDALGALALLVQQMEDKGVIIAASRRTFFDTEDYAKRTGMLRRRIAGDCEFDQIRLLDWTREEDVNFLSDIRVDDKKIAEPSLMYTQILDELHGEATHPMLARPFLLTHLVRGLLRYNVTPSDFIRGMKDPLEGVNEVVNAFIQREVTEKWMTQDSGEPYLSIEQHLQLLTEVAREMWSSQVDRLSNDVIETITLLLMDQWRIREDRKRQIIDMVKMHVMLTIPSDGDEKSRSFDHPEFRNYFVAHSFAELIAFAIRKETSTDLGNAMSIAQLPDSVASYCAKLLDRKAGFIVQFVSLMSDLVSKEWKPTFLQTNVGTMLPCMLDGLESDILIHFKGRAVFSSIVFEKTQLRNITFSDANFLNVSFTGVKWENIEFNNCEFSGITLDRTATYKSVRMISCRIHEVRVVDNDEEIARGYSPERIQEILGFVGIMLDESLDQQVRCQPLETEARKLAYRILRIFRRTTAISEYVLNLKIPSGSENRHRDQIINLMEKHGIIEEKDWRGGGKSKLWILKRSLDDILTADCGKGDAALVRFWTEVDKL